MKVLFFDSLFPRGHISINSRYIKILQNNNELIICSKTGWFECDTSLKHVDANWYYPSEKKDNRLFCRFKVFENCLKMAKISKKINPDIIYVASYDIIAVFFALPFWFPFRNKIVLQEHNNVDQLENKIKNRVYSFYKNYFHHFVLEEYIKERLIKLNVKPQLIHVVPHPLPQIVQSEPNDVKLITGLSNSNDENIIKNLFIKYQKNSLLKKLKCKIVVKAKKISYEDENLKIFNGWITKDEYENYCKQSNYCLIPFPKNYSYRVSAVFLEAVSNSKLILASKFALADYYSKKYPGLCQVFADVSEMLALIEKMDKELYFEARKRFMLDHSDLTITKKFNNALHEIVKGL